MIHDDRQSIACPCSPRRSNWVPFEVTVKFRLIPAQEPTGPQSVGGLQRVAHLNEPRPFQATSNTTHSKCTTSALGRREASHVFANKPSKQRPWTLTRQKSCRKSACDDFSIHTNLHSHETSSNLLEDLDSALLRILREWRRLCHLEVDEHRGAHCERGKHHARERALSQLGEHQKSVEPVNIASEARPRGRVLGGTKARRVWG